MEEVPMNTREIATEYRKSQWAQALREMKENGESVKSFCARKGVSKNTYFYWQRKLRESACLELQAVVGENVLAPSGWAVCEEPKVDTGRGTITIEIGNSRIVARADVSAEHLEKVCRVLMRIC
jgi:putative transposase